MSVDESLFNMGHLKRIYSELKRDIMIWNIRFDRFSSSFYYKLFNRGGDELIVFMPSLIQPKNKIPDIYNRLSWADSFSCSCLFVSDPGITESVRGSWFQGTQEFFAIEALADDLRAIAGQFNFDLKKTILYGSSQGGFVSLACASYLSEVLVLAECPQSDIRLFVQKEDTARAAMSCYGVKSFEETPEEFAYRLSLPEIFKKRGYIPRAKVIVKETDIHCTNVQLPKLIEYSQGRIEVNVLTGSEGEGGHTGISREIITDTLNRMRSQIAELYFCRAESCADKIGRCP
ncbi:hypothetical protein [Azospirillum aestuarii]|uniref:hypothetical protein n=1 Tax=Azospirillum aestuarii TaxID=2802052 RepID=UPI004054DE6A